MRYAATLRATVNDEPRTYRATIDAPNERAAAKNLLKREMDLHEGWFPDFRSLEVELLKGPEPA